MPKIIRRGSGITERIRHQFDMTDANDVAELPDYLRQIIATRPPAKRSYFETRVSELEEIARIALEGAPGTRADEDSPAGYAARLLDLIRLGRSAIKRGDTDATAAFAYDIGALATEARIVFDWNTDAVRGRNAAVRLRAERAKINRNATLNKDARYRGWRAEAQKVKAAHPHMTKADIARAVIRRLKLTVSHRTVLRAIG